MIFQAVQSQGPRAKTVLEWISKRSCVQHKIVAIMQCMLSPHSYLMETESRNEELEVERASSPQAGIHAVVNTAVA